MAPSAGFRIEIASVPDRESLVAEVWWGGELFAELRHVEGGVAVQVFRPSTSAQWDAGLGDLIAALEQARQRLGPPQGGGHDEEDLGDPSAPPG